MLTRRFDGVAFDLEGTVVDVENVHHMGFAQAAMDAGVEINLDDIENVLSRIPGFIGGGDQKVVEGIYQISDGRLSIEEILARKKAYYELRITHEDIKPREGFIEVFQRLRDLGIPVAIGSLTPTDKGIFLLEKSGLVNLFPQEKIVLKENVRALKPAPDVYLETAKRMGISPERQLVFEDSPTGVKAAVAAGSQAIGIPVYQQTVSSLLDAGARRVFGSWKNVDIDGLLKGEFEHGRNPETLT